MSPSQQAVLISLARQHYDDVNCLTFSGIQSQTGLDRRVIRLACRALARQGLARYVNGLWSDNGPAGAGYCSTDAGYEFVRPDLDEEDA